MDEQLRRVKRFWKELGPGLITGAADDDPSGVATYSQAGARYGFQYLWLAPATFPLVATVQEMCARIGIVTGRGLAENIRREYPAWALWLVVSLLFIANAFNIGADLAAMADAVRLIAPRLPAATLVVSFALVSLLLQVFVSYASYARYLKYLTFALFAYIITGLLIGLDWGDALRHTVMPSIAFSPDAFLLMCAVLGTTISPYLFFWQSSQEVEEEIGNGSGTLEEREGATAAEIRDMRVDVWSGMFVSNVVMFFIIAVCATTLFAYGVTDIRTAADAAAALEPLAGVWAKMLFAVGIVGVGFLAVPVLAGSSAYAIAETLHWREGLYLRLREAAGFYGIIAASMAIALLLGTFGIDSMKALFYSAVLNGLVAPFVLFFVVRLASDESIMGQWVSGPVAAFVGRATIVAMAAAGVTAVLTLFS